VLGIVIGNPVARGDTVCRGRRAARAGCRGCVDRWRTKAARPPAPNGTSARLDTREHVLGLGMIRRVCERRGWMLDESVDPGGGRAFVLRFG
jgi:hypothetical protein